MKNKDQDPWKQDLLITFVLIGGMLLVTFLYGLAMHLYTNLLP